MARTSTYLNFGRETESAFLFYQSIFGGEFLGGIHRFSGMPMPPGAPTLNPEDAKLIMHIELAITGGHVLMGTDSPASMGFHVNFGNNTHINLEPDTRAETERLFHALSEGGTVLMGLQDMFWGAYFGSCKDKFGVQWMLNFTEKNKELSIPSVDPKLDLVLEKFVDVPVEKVWKAWTQPDILVKWFTPDPWKTTSCKMELRAGGIFHTIMQSPEGDSFPNTGCFLEVIENRKLVWTSALLPGYRPVQKVESGADMLFTATLLFEPHQQGTKYTAIVAHENEADCQRHNEMGFHIGWGKALEQLVATVRNENRK